MRTILVPLDGSTFAEAAIPVAVRLAAQHESPLHVVAVHAPAQPLHTGVGSLHPDPAVEGRDRTRLATYLEELRARLATAPGADVHVALLEGPVVTTIAEHAARLGAELVVCTSHGRGGASRLWLGSVTDGLALRLRVPMLVVRPQQGGAPTADVGPFRRVLIPLDPAHPVAHSIDVAVAVAGTDHVHFRVMACIVPLHPVLRAVASEREESRDAAEQRALATAFVAEIEQSMRARGCDVSSTICSGPNPAREILNEADASEADLIAIATHARGQVGRLVLGSVADKVLRGAGVAVLLDPIRNGTSTPPGSAPATRG